MVDFLARLFDPSGFPARWQCGSGWAETPWLGWLHILSDLGVWSAYLAIPLVLGYFLLRRKDLPFRKIFLLFGAFILACGTTHLMEAIIFWWPAYRLAGVIKLFTAVVSWTTVFALFRVVPRVLTMRTPEELEREIAARMLAEEELQRANIELEQRVQARTTDLTQAVAALRNERELLQTTLTSIGDGIIVTDPEGRVTFLNGVAEMLTGWTTADARGVQLAQVFQIVNERTRQPVANPVMRALQQGVIMGLANHTILLARDGTERPIDDSAAPIRFEDGTIRGAVLVFRDITERKRAEEAVGRLAAIVESSDDAIVTKGFDGVITSWNRSAEKMYGYTAQEAVGEHISLIIPHERRSEEDEVVTRLRRGEKVEHFETERQTKDGRFLTISLTMSVVKDGEGHIIGISKVARDITEQKRVEDELRHLAAKLSETDHRKDEFLAMLAHELRNPLAPIRNALQIVRLSAGNEAAIHSASETMERQIRHMVRLVDDLLDVSRISRGKIDLRRERVELAAIIHQAVESSRPAIESAQHQLTVTLPPNPLYLDADPVRLAQVFSNLLNNAAKYSEPKGRITLTVERKTDEVAVSVKDTGVGIPSEMLTKIFEMFTQVDTSLERSQGGLGIGLTLVERLVTMHGGSVSALSEGPGRGSEFIVRLPVMIETPTTPQKSDPTVSEPRKNGPGRILVVDDNRDSATTLAMVLKLTGHETHTAHDGLAAVEAADTFRPDVILLDIGLPKLNGYEVARKIREQPWGQKMVLVALTGWGQEDDRRKSSEAGFNGHMVKPVDHAALMKLLGELLPT